MLANYTGWSFFEIGEMAVDDFILWIKDIRQLEDMRINQQ
jgi:hypothetical protein